MRLRLRRHSQALQAEAAPGALAALMIGEMPVDSQPTGAQAEEVIHQEAAVLALMDRTAVDQVTVGTGAEEAHPAEAQEVPEVAGIPEVLEEEAAPQMRVTTTDGEVAATVQMLQRCSAGLSHSMSSRSDEGAAPTARRSGSAIGARPSRSRLRPPSRRTSSGNYWPSRRRCGMSKETIGKSGSFSKRQFGSTRPAPI